MIPRPPLSGISPPLGWVARYTVEEEPDGMWVALLAVWALMQDDEGNTWVAGIEPTGAGDDGRPCDETGNFLDYAFTPNSAARCWTRPRPKYVIQRGPGERDALRGQRRGFIMIPPWVQPD